MILLPAIAYSLLTLIFTESLRVSDILDAFVKAHLVTFTFILVSTELLSVVQAISFPGLLAAWILFLLICMSGAVFFLSRRNRGFILPELQWPAAFTTILIGAIAFILVFTFLTAVLYPPNNSDSMTYHMSRVVHWISNNNISFYPTNITRQNYQMPLAEFAIMHLQILCGADIYANLVQWVSFLVLICLGALTAVELGLNNRQMLISATIMATIPMAILQASSTQNDLVLSSFVVTFGLFMLRIHKELSIRNMFFAAIALGLALLTKGTAYLYCAAVGMSLAIPVFLKYRSDCPRLLKVLAALSLIVIVAFVMNAGHLSRNYKLYGHPLSTETGLYQNSDMSMDVLMANIVRNGALHLGTPSDQINLYTKRIIQKVLGSQLNNPKTTWPGKSFYIPYSRHEDYAGNLIHMLLVLLSVICLPLLWRRDRYSKAIWYAIGTMLGAVFYCWMLKWQPWASRLHTPLFALASPLLTMTITAEGVCIGKRSGRVILLCMIFYSLIFVCANKNRSLVSLDWFYKDRMKLYFESRSPAMFQDYEKAINITREAGQQEVGLYLGETDWEYPFWALALSTRREGRVMSFRHVGVSNVSKTLDKNLFQPQPQYVIATKKLVNWENAAKYTPVYISKYFSVFKKFIH